MTNVNNIQSNGAISVTANNEAAARNNQAGLPMLPETNRRDGGQSANHDTILLGRANRWRMSLVYASLFVIGTAFLPVAAAQTNMSALLVKYSNYDYPPVDGKVEINSLTPVDGVQGNPDALPRDAPLTLVLVEPRLMNTLGGSTFGVSDLKQRLIRYKEDLAAEGRQSLVLAASVYAGTNRQGGRTVLALRRFLQDVRANYPKLEGVLFVGHFPEAALVRKWPWPRQVGKSADCGNVDFGSSNILLIGAEMIAPRTDIPLADLDGNWENLYRQAPTPVEVVCAAPLPANASSWQNGFQSASFNFTSQKFIIGSRAYDDFFLVDDAKYTATTSADGKTLTVNVTTALRNAEVSANDKLRPTPMAMPDIYVSRIDPFAISYQHDPNFKDTNGQGLYDQQGMPRTLSQQPGVVFAPDLERTLLVQYFDNNHQFRLGYFASRPFRPGAASNPESDFPVADRSKLATQARADWTASATNTPVNPGLADYAAWLQKDVSLRYVMAHSDALGSVFQPSSTSQLNTAVGPYHHWIQQGNQWVSSWADTQSGGQTDAQFWFYRSLWMNQKLKDTAPSLMIHTGCEVNTPADFAQNAESMLFYGKTLAITARAKVYYDDPEGWQDYFRSNGSAVFGDVWSRNYLTLSADSKLWQKDYAGVKRAYWWSTVGDYTLRLRYTPAYVTGKTTVSYADTSGTNLIYSFAQGKNGHLVTNYWDGAWHWSDLGLPAGATAIYNPNAIMYNGGSAPQVYVFATASNGHLAVAYLVGGSWQWSDLGLPIGATAVYNVNAMTFGPGAKQIYVFGKASNGHLVVNYWDGDAWHWADQGLPAGATEVNNPSAITSDGQQLYVFAAASNGHLVVNRWNGGSWQWEDRGQAPNSGGISAPNAVVYKGGGGAQIYVYCAGNAGGLVVNYGSGASWSWANQGLPAGATRVYSPSAVASGSSGLYVFGTANNGHLVVNYWDGGAWQWADQGLPAGATSVSYPNAITWGSDGSLFVFGTNNGRLFVNYYYTGGGWNWADQGIL